MAVYEIPLLSVQQTFRVQLAGKDYRVKLYWCESFQSGWVIDILTSEDQPLVKGIPLVTGADLLAQYEYLEFSGALYVRSDEDPDLVPNFRNLGSESHLFFETTP